MFAFKFAETNERRKTCLVKVKRKQYSASLNCWQKLQGDKMLRKQSQRLMKRRKKGSFLFPSGTNTTTTQRFPNTATTAFMVTNSLG